MLKNSMAKKLFIAVLAVSMVLSSIPVFALYTAPVIQPSAAGASIARYPWVTAAGSGAGVALDSSLSSTAGAIQYTPVIATIDGKTYSFSMYYVNPSSIGIKVVDVSTPYYPQKLTFAQATDEDPYLMTTVPTTPVMHGVAVRTESDGHTYLYSAAATWKIAGASPVATNQIRKIDVTNPKLPQVVTYYYCDLASNARYIELLDDRMYVTNGTAIKIYNTNVTGGHDNLVATGKYGIPPLFTTSNSATEKITVFAVKKSGGYTYIYGAPMQAYATLNATQNFVVLKISDTGGNTPTITEAAKYTKDLKKYIQHSGSTATSLGKAYFRNVCLIGDYVYVPVGDTSSTSTQVEYETVVNNYVFAIDVSDSALSNFSNVDSGIGTFKPAIDDLTNNRGGDASFSYTSYLTWWRPAYAQADGNLLYILHNTGNVTSWFVYDVTDNKYQPKYSTVLQSVASQDNLFVLAPTSFAKKDGYLYVTFQKAVYTKDSTTYYPVMQVFKASSICITSHVQNSIVSGTSITVRGTSTGGSKTVAANITVTVGSNTPQTVTPATDGSWSCTVNNVANGPTTITAALTAEDADNVSTTKSITVSSPYAFTSPAYVNNGNNTITASLTGDNNTSDDTSVIMIMALYKGTQMVKVTTTSNPLGHNTTGTPMATTLNVSPLPGDVNLSGYTIKTFFWNGFSEIKPFTANDTKALPLL